jgi:LysR family transcriptional regulator, hydrogen peroxide-inducible genes activator
MTITQLEYIVALAEHQNFSKAADFCCVSQPSLSMQIQKLEEELNVVIFNRKAKPICPSPQGEEILQTARRILVDAKSILSLSKGWSADVSGSVSIGVIPTIAPYLIPKFLSKFQKSFPHLSIRIAETTTENIKKELKAGKLDIGILVTPLNEEFIEIPLYYEELFLYSNACNSLGEIDKILDPEKLWLLEEGHCLSNQVNSICNMQNRQHVESRIAYDTGSLETIVRLAEDGNGQTIIPQMLINYLDPTNQNKVFDLPSPSPVREISIVHTNQYTRKGIIQAFKKAILAEIPEEWLKLTGRSIIPI